MSNERLPYCLILARPSACLGWDDLVLYCLGSPPWLITDQELRDILAHLKSLPAARAPKDIPLLNQLEK